MLKHLLAASSAAAVALVLSTGTGTAHADTQPANLGNVASVDRGASATGPHCHFVLPARGAGPFADIITGAAHQAHTETGTPTGIFERTTCPGEPTP